VLGLSTTVTSIINFSAMVGVVAGGGLGSVALRYGYQRYSVIHMVTVIVVVFTIVMILQAMATRYARKLARPGSVSSTAVRDKIATEVSV
jgi:D-methionine transport system permease protein